MFDPGAMQMKDLTTDDVSRINKAMKTEQFGSLMQDYLQEISDPNNRAEYDQYMEQLESKGELPEGTELLRCEPGFCVRTDVCFKNGQTQKCFINVCFSPLLRDVEMVQAPGGHQVSLPFALSPPRVDQDSKSSTCLTCDFGLSENSFAQCKNNPDFLRMIVDIATKNLSTNFLKGFEEVKNDFRVLKKTNCKGGKPYLMSVRVENLRPDKKRKKKNKKSGAAAAGDGITPGELKEMKKDATQRMKNMVESSDEDEEETTAPIEDESKTKKVRVPQHRLVHQGQLELIEFENIQPGMSEQKVTPNIPANLKLVVKLPGVASAADIELDVQKDNVVLETRFFYLDLPLPYEILPDDGTAKFDKPKKELTLSLPVLNSAANLRRGTSAESTSADDKEQEQQEDDLSKWLASRSNYEKYGIGAVDGNDDVISDADEDGEMEDLPADEEKASEKTTGVEQGDELSEDATAKEPQAETGGDDKSSETGHLAEKKVEQPCAQDDAPKEEEEVTYVSPRNKPLAEAWDDRGKPFIPAASWIGPRPGYYFGTSARGTGYHKDPHQCSSSSATSGRSSSSSDQQEHIKENTTGSTSPSSKRSKTNPKPKEPLIQEVENQDSPGRTPSSSSSVWVRNDASSTIKHGNDIKPAEALPGDFLFHPVEDRGSAFFNKQKNVIQVPVQDVEKDFSDASKDGFFEFETSSHICILLPPWPGATVQSSSKTRNSASKVHLLMSGPPGSAEGGKDENEEESPQQHMAFHLMVTGGKGLLRVPQRWTYYATPEATVFLIEKAAETKDGDLGTLLSGSGGSSTTGTPRIFQVETAAGEGDAAVGGAAGGSTILEDTGRGIDFRSFVPIPLSERDKLVRKQNENAASSRSKQERLLQGDEEEMEDPDEDGKGKGLDENDGRHQNEEGADTTGGGGDPLMHVRADDDAAMAHAVLLRTRLFLDLM
ncbi:unnamed protein product [Amoebophrya sp. A25]|nr:unnamed protein product [Amoebophrya sp. A25]|eukprot:GSA25T00023085001.1